MQEFLKHVKEGFSKSPKQLSSRYFYDEKGDKLFQQIMQLDEYYLPRCEMQIIQNQSEQIAKDISAFHSNIQIVELGAGDGSKTGHLLSRFAPYFESIKYVALDISANVLAINEKNIKDKTNLAGYRNVPGNYFETYKNLSPVANGRLAMFLGANIGNFINPEATGFFSFVKSNLSENDFFLVAFDLVKHPRKILAAYDDSKGITKQFNLNLLERINRELGANFDLRQFDHFPFYNPQTGIAYSHIISLKKQSVRLAGGFTIFFDAFEAILTEISKKYFWRDIEEIAHKSKMSIRHTYFDSNKEYAFVLFQPHE